MSEHNYRSPSIYNYRVSREAYTGVGSAGVTARTVAASVRETYTDRGKYEPSPVPGKPLTSLRRSAIFLVVPVSTANAYANAADGRCRRHELDCRRCRRRRRGRGRCPATGFRVFPGAAAAATVSTEVCVRATNIKRKRRTTTGDLLLRRIRRQFTVAKAEMLLLRRKHR